MGQFKATAAELFRRSQLGLELKAAGGLQTEAHFGSSGRIGAVNPEGESLVVRPFGGLINRVARDDND
jgi:hypothetical protein